MADQPVPPDSNPTPFDGSTEWEALARYLADESPADEAEAIRRRLAEHPADGELLTALDRAVSRIATPPSDDIDVEAALRIVTDRRVALESRPRIVPGIALRPATRWQWRNSRLAIAAVVVLAAGLLIWRRASPPGSQGGTAGVSRTFATTVGQRDSVRLPDGSTIVLAPTSRLIVAAGYGDSHRTVELHGEAFFEVAHDDARPFVVHADAATIRDIGTTFNVRSEFGDSVVVTVRTGTVLMDGLTGGGGVGSDGGVVLHAGDLGVLDTKGRVVPRRGGASEDNVAWMRGTLVFREAPMSEVAAELRRWYGVELRLGESSLAGRHLQATFTGEPVEQVLRVIGTALGAEVERRGDTAFVRARGEKRSR